MTAPPTPLLILTDSPDGPTGLGRIGRELALHIHSHMQDRVRVGLLGRGGMGGDFPFPVWTIPALGAGTIDEWGASVLPRVWETFAGDARGVLLTIYDPARMIWLAQSHRLFDCPLKEWLADRRSRFDLWGYFPIDGNTPSGGVGRMAEDALAGYDRVLAYGGYGARVIGKALGRSDVEWLPHGLAHLWRPRDKQAARALLGLPDDALVVGVVAANQQRKDWGLAAEVGAKLRSRLGKDGVRLWWHVDHLQNPRAWDIDALVAEFGLGDVLTISRAPVDDEWLAQGYSACDVTMAIGAGEGFGYPIVESQACGVPVVGWDYAGGAEYCSAQVPMTARRLDGPTNVMRPVGYADLWAAVTMAAADHAKTINVAPLRWDVLWPRWQRWIEEGLGGR